MSRYRKVDPRIWNDAKFRDLSDSAKLVFFFLLTHPHMTAIGAMRASIPGLASEIGWETKAFQEAFQEACSKGMVEHDQKASFVWLPKFLKYNKPESPNVVKAWVNALEYLPECFMLTRTIAGAKALLEGMPKTFLDAFPIDMSKAMAYQEQEHEHKHKQEQAKTLPAALSLAPEVETVLQESCRKTWSAYSSAYFDRYGTEPVRNAKVNACVKNFVKRIPTEEAPEVARFFVGHNDSFYVRKMHDFGLLLADSEKVRTEWATNRTVTATKARQLEKSSGMYDAVSEILAERGMQ